MSFRIDFHALLMVFQVLNGLAPLCITHCLSFYVYPHTLRPSAACLLNVPKITTKKMGNAGFIAIAFRLWSFCCMYQTGSLTGRHLNTFWCFVFVLFCFFLEIGMSFNLTLILHLVYVLYAANIGELSSIVTHFLANYLLRSFAFM